MALDISPLVAAAVAVTSLAAAVIGGVSGMSTGVIAIPVLTFAFGIRLAIPIVTVAMLFNTLSRSVANWSDVDWRVARWYSYGAVPSAALGGVVFASAPAELLARGLGIFLIGLVVYRRLPIAARTMPLRGFLFVGLGQGFFSAIFGGAGPFGAHFFLAYGLRRNAFVGTIAVGTVLVSIAKALVYGGFSLLDRDALLAGVAVGLIMAVGAWIGARLVRRMPERAFVFLVEGVMLASGALLLATA